MTDLYAQAAKKGWNTEAPKGNYRVKLVNLQFVASTTKPWAKGQPEIKFWFSIQDEGFLGVKVDASILPLDEGGKRTTPSGKEFDADPGIMHLSKMMACLGITLRPDEVTEERVKAELIDAKERGAEMMAHWTGKTLYPNRSIDPNTIQPKASDFTESDIPI